MTPALGWIAKSELWECRCGCWSWVVGVEGNSVVVVIGVVIAVMFCDQGPLTNSSQIFFKC